ncbi:MAG: nucleotidyltransferase family protein [Pseudomonadota bacterium]
MSGMEVQLLDTAMVLGAGFGTRMGPLTADRPKPLVEVAGRALIDRVIDRLIASGVRRVVVNVHYQADVLEAHLGRRSDVTIAVCDERDLLRDTGGGIAHALPLLGDSAFFIHNSDAIWREAETAAVDAMRSAWSDDEMDVLLLLADRETALGYDGRGDFVRDEVGRLRRVRNGEVGEVFAGLSIAHPRVFDGSHAEVFSLNRIWDTAIATGRAAGVRLDGQWMHVGTPEAVCEASALIREISRGDRSA